MMPLPDDFGPVQTDETGRLYVVHKPSGVIYYVKDEVVKRGRAVGATVKVYTPSAAHIDTRAQEQQHKQRKPARQHSLALVPRSLGPLPWAGMAEGVAADPRDALPLLFPERRRHDPRNAPAMTTRDEKKPPRVNRARFLPGSEPRR